MNNWIEISDAALAHNLHALQASAGHNTEVLAVIKANAYGHGAERCAPVLVGAGARWLGVTCASEGARVRRALGDLAARILVMNGPLPEDSPLIREHALTPVLWTPQQSSWLPPGTPVHLEIDTGMSRQGARPGEQLAALLLAVRSAGLRVEGIFTHFCSSEEAPGELTRRQQTLFEHAVAQARKAGERPAWVHAGNSSTIDNPVEDHARTEPWLVRLAASVDARAMVRSGLALYGYCLPIATSDGAADPQVRPALRPVLTWHARVLAMHDLAAGEGIGYNQTFTAPHAMRVALLPVGYADGLRRELSSRTGVPGGWVMLDGCPAPILGRVSMNLTVVDVSAIPTAAPLSLATLLGPGITAEDHARLAGTVAYEILCGIHPCG